MLVSIGTSISKKSFNSEGLGLEMSLFCDDLMWNDPVGSYSDVWLLILVAKVTFYFGHLGFLHYGYHGSMFSFVSMLSLVTLATMVAIVNMVTMFKLAETTYGTQPPGWGEPLWVK
jgi:hypothetical protein